MHARRRQTISPCRSTCPEQPSNPPGSPMTVVEIRWDGPDPQAKPPQRPRPRRRYVENGATPRATWSASAVDVIPDDEVHADAATAPATSQRPSAIPATMGMGQAFPISEDGRCIAAQGGRAPRVDTLQKGTRRAARSCRSSGVPDARMLDDLAVPTGARPEHPDIRNLVHRRLQEPPDEQRSRSRPAERIRVLR